MSDSNNAPQSPRPTELVVGLAVVGGSHAGVTAEIKEGIYMIGRDRECQIRPKSQSVSDRHCLVQHQASVVRVFDLDSEEGTFVNDQRLAPKTWRLLNHGDRLRCGRYIFEVIIHLKEEYATSRQFSSSVEEANAVRHDRARVGVQSVTDFDTDDSATEFDDTALDNEFEFEGFEAGQLPSRAAEKEPDSTVAPSGDAKPAKSRVPLPKPKISYRGPSRFSGFSLSLGGADTWKVGVACILLIATVGYAGWTVYKIANGAPVKVLRGID